LCNNAGNYAYEYAKAKFLVNVLGKFSKLSDITQEVSLGGASIKTRSINVLKAKNFITAADSCYLLFISCNYEHTSF
jgi:hypothetical protein